MTNDDLFRLIHAGHDVTEVEVVCGPSRAPLICWTCHEEEHPEDEAP